MPTEYSVLTSLYLPNLYLLLLEPFPKSMRIPADGMYKKFDIPVFFKGQA